MVRGPEKLRDIVRRRIRELRRERGLTQEELCERAGISVDAVSRIESGSRSPTLETLDCIAAALSVSPVAFFEAVERAPAQPSAPVRRLVALLEGRQDPLLQLAEKIVTLLVRANPQPRKPRRRRPE